jgi:hypothetical protein
MAKRHHSSHHSSHVHSVHRSKHLGEEHYASHDERRRQENLDFHMISEDHNAIANLPQSVHYFEYPKIHGWTPEDLDDTMHGVDAQINFDDSKKMSHFHPKKI